MEKASVISAMTAAGSSAKPEMKMKPKPTRIWNTPWSTGPAPRSLNSGNKTAVTMIIPATRQAARKAKAMTKRRPISAMGRMPSLRAKRSNPEMHPRKDSGLLRRCGSRNDEVGRMSAHRLIRHRHRAERLAFAGGQFLGLRLELTAGGEDVAAAR